MTWSHSAKSCIDGVTKWTKGNGMVTERAVGLDRKNYKTVRIGRDSSLACCLDREDWSGVIMSMEMAKSSIF